MAWLAVTLNVEPANADMLADALLEAGAVSVDVADAYAGTPRECPRFNEPGEPASPQWELARIAALFGEHADVAAALPLALAAAGYDPAHAYEVAHVADQDWVRAAQADFRPVHVSPRLWVVGLAGLIVVALVLHWWNPLLLILIVMSIPQVIAAWQGHVDPAYFKLSAWQRIGVGTAYTALIGVLIVLMILSHIPVPAAVPA